MVIKKINVYIIKARVKKDIWSNVHRSLSYFTGNFPMG